MGMRAKPYGVMALMAIVLACGDRARDSADSTRALPPVYPAGPVETNWDSEAGPLLIVAAENGSDSAAVVLPEATDSTISTFSGITPPVTGLAFDLFSRAGKTDSSVVVTPLPAVDNRGECDSWPRARLQRGIPEWRVGFASGHVSAIQIDSIEAKSSSDSSALAVALAQTVATLPVAADPTFHGLPFRVRSAYTFRRDSMDIVIADIVRTVNEEANPRVEHLFIIGEKAHGLSGKFTPAYFSRTAGSEDSIQATDVLAVVQIGPEKKPAVVVSIEYDDGGKLGLIERTASGKWAVTWRSAYTDC